MPYTIATRFMSALAGYRTVRSAVSRLEEPPRWGLERVNARPPRSYIWRQAPLTRSQWDALDTQHGFDVRGTSPRWIARRAAAVRAQRKQAAGSGFYTATRPARETPEPFIGPPSPRVHAGTDDLFMVWPPVSAADLAGIKPPEDTRAPLDKAINISTPFTGEIIDRLYDLLGLGRAPKSLRVYDAKAPP